MWSINFWITPALALILAVVVATQFPSQALGIQGALQHFQQVFDILRPSRYRTKDDWNILYHQGGNSPWIPKIVGDTESIDVPPGCYVDQVHMLSRHAERYPTLKSGIRMLELYHRLLHSNVTFEGPLSFINTWNFFMPDPAGRLENLVPVGPYAGTLEAFQTGVKLRTRYENLVAQAIERNQTRLWASGSTRVEETARYFAAGMYGLDWQSIASVNVIPESSSLGADTLTPGDTCLSYRDYSNPTGHDLGYTKLADWQAQYLPPIAKRLATLVPELTFTTHEIYTMQEICGFETLARGYSPWCDVFSHTEWRSFEYARDLLHFYRAGPGNPFGNAMGWLYLNATTDLLVSGPEEEGPLFFSFAHDGDIIPFLAAMDLLPQEKKGMPSDPSTPPEKRIWRTSDVVPMGGRVILERMSCPRGEVCWSNAPFYPDHVYCEAQPPAVHVRVNVNDAIVPLPACHGGPGGSCPLAEWVEHVRARGEVAGDFGKMCGLDEDAPSRVTFLKQPAFVV